MTLFKLTFAALLASSTAFAALAEPIVSAPVPAFTAKANPSAAFPDIGSSWAPEGRFVGSKAIRMVAPGLTRPQVYALVQEPMFNELLPGKKTWNYIFDFYTGKGTDFVKCQFQIVWDHGPMRVADAYWQTAECAKMVADMPPPPPPPLPPVVVEKKAEAKTIPYVVYFAFDRADVTPEATKVVRDAADFEHSGTDGHAVVVGHTDASGSVDYNMGLSERRAKAVADGLVADGADAKSLDVSWKGKSDLAVPTPDGVKEPLNRRVTIAVTATVVPK